MEVRNAAIEYIIGVILIGFLIAHLASMVYKAEPADIVPQEYLKKLNHNTKWFLITIYFLSMDVSIWYRRNNNHASSSHNNGNRINSRDLYLFTNSNG